MIEAYETGKAPAFELYGLGLEHKHMPEIQLYSGLDRPADFRAVGWQLPAGNAGQRAVASRHCCRASQRSLTSSPSSGSITGAISISISRESGDTSRIEPESLNGTNDIEIHVYPNEARGQALLVAKFDNLGKGASGAAVQNLMLMLGR